MTAVDGSNAAMLWRTGGRATVGSEPRAADAMGAPLMVAEDTRRVLESRRIRCRSARRSAAVW